MLTKSTFAIDFDTKDLERGYEGMRNDIIYRGLPDSVLELFDLAWADFMSLKFSFDGATFFPEKAYGIWEWQSFIHDWYNGIGFVGYYVDAVFKDLMKACKFHPLQYYPRSFMMGAFTWINILRHKYYLRDLRKMDDNSEIYLLSERVRKDLK